jgi:superfamily II DNA helicase RecQ
MSAYGNAYPALQHMGIIVRNGSLTERGRRWLDDAAYREVCEEIVNEIYPNELINDIPEPLHNREAVKNWFHESTGATTNPVLQMTATYLLLRKAEVDDQYSKDTLKIAAKSSRNNSRSADSAAAKTEPRKKAAVDERVKRKYTRRNQDSQALDSVKPAAKAIDKDQGIVEENNITPSIINNPETNIDMANSRPQVNINTCLYQ